MGFGVCSAFWDVGLEGEIQMNGLLDHCTQILHNHNSIQSVISITILYNPYLLVTQNNSKPATVLGSVE